MDGFFPQYLFGSAAQRKLMRRSCTVFTYHKLGRVPAGSRDPFLYVSVKNFDRQLAALNRNGVAVKPLNEALSSARPDNLASITFDDGFRNVLENGLEILARHRVQAIQYIVSGLIGKQNEWDISKGEVGEPLMDAVEIREWISAGHEIGSHSVTHRNLKKLTGADLREEIFASKKALEDQFNIPVQHFGYPFGGWNPQVRDLVEEAGYKTATTMIFGVNDSTTDRFALKRIIPLSAGELLRKVFHRILQKSQ